MNKICRFFKKRCKSGFTLVEVIVLCTASNSSYGNDAVYHAYSQVV